MQQHEFIEAFRQIRPVITPLTTPFCNTNQQAAVLIPVVIRPKLTLLFTRRAKHLRHHPGQICFPGGKHDTGDHSMKSTAIRECCEEVNLQPDNINIIGSLPLVHASSGFTVHPIIGLIVPPQQWEYNSQEVDEVFEVPVSHFLQQKHYQLFDIARNGQRYQLCSVAWNERLIWGLTGTILYYFGQTISNDLNEGLRGK